ncbi:unnamed protein product [Prorocentrum cordatum]|uniref:EF-hand domain-containing protein n=1 Tax=Prorocentrum cordatum TaxID=2364126 RepID=A0ABN9V3X4_9DINO|nr:unnamed protein product [Polarella glacialis]
MASHDRRLSHEARPLWLKRHLGSRRAGMPSPKLARLALAPLEIPSAARPSQPQCQRLLAMDGSGSGHHPDEDLLDDSAADFLPCTGAGSSFQAALQGVAAEHEREVQRLQTKMAELRELVTHLQWKSVGQEVKSTNVEVSDVHGSPLVVKTVMANGRTFMTLEPPELDVHDPGGFCTPTDSSSDDDSAGSPGNNRASGNKRAVNQNGRASLCSSQASSIQVRRATKERPGDRPRGRSLKYDPWEDGNISEGGDAKSPRLKEYIPPLPPESVSHMLAPGSCLSTRSTTDKQTARGRHDPEGVESSGNGMSHGGQAGTEKEQQELLLQSQQDGDGRSESRCQSDGTADGGGNHKSRGQTTLQTCDSEGLRRRTVDDRTSQRLAREVLEYETKGQRLWRERQSLQRSKSVVEANVRQCTFRLEQLVNHWSFDFACGLVIIINTVLIGLSTQHVAEKGGDKVEYEIAGLICNAFFLVELILRLRVMGMRFFTVEGWRWNLFDMFLVVFSILDAVIQYGYNADAGAVGQSMKTIKMLRIVRVFRVFRFFTELRILALMILDSFRSLAWALLMLIIIMYVFAIWFTQDVASHIVKVKNDGLPVDPVLTEFFGNLLLTLSSLFHAMLNGISWIELTNGLKYSPPMQALFFFYVSFTLLAVLNIIRLLPKQIEQKQKWLQEMKELFQEMDKEGCGSISLDTIQEFLQDARVESYFQALGLEPHDTERLFDHLDDDNSGEVSLDEFLQGCLRLRGQARSIDVYSVMHDVRSLTTKFEELMDSLRVVGRLASEHSNARQNLSGAAFSKQGTVTTLPEPVEEAEMPTVIQRSTKPALMADGKGDQSWTSASADVIKGIVRCQDELCCHHWQLYLATHPELTYGDWENMLCLGRVREFIEHGVGVLYAKTQMGDVVGYLSFSRLNSEADPTSGGQGAGAFLKVNHLVVLERHRRAGVGRLLMTEFLHKVGVRIDSGPAGPTTDPEADVGVQIIAAELNEGAISWYRSMGFRAMNLHTKECGERKICYLDLRRCWGSAKVSGGTDLVPSFCGHRRRLFGEELCGEFVQPPRPDGQQSARQPFRRVTAYDAERGLHRLDGPDGELADLSAQFASAGGLCLGRAPQRAARSAMGDTTAAEQVQGTCLVVGAAMVFALVALVVKAGLPGAQKLSESAGLFVILTAVCRVDPLPLLPATQCRFFISWLVSIAFMLAYRKERGLRWFGPARLRWALVLKGTLSFTFITLWWGALRRAPMGNCIAIIYCSPVLTSLFSRALLGEALPREFAAQTLLVSCGVALVLDPPFLHRGGAGPGDGAAMLRDYGPVFLALLVCAMVPVATKATRDCSWIEVEHVNACLATCVYGPSLMLAQHALGGAAPLLPAGADSAWQSMLIVFAALGSFVGIAMETKGYQLAEVGKATMFRYVEVPTGESGVAEGPLERRAGTAPILMP